MSDDAEILRFPDRTDSWLAGLDEELRCDGNRWGEGRYDQGRYDEGRYDEGRYDEGRYDELAAVVARRPAPTPVPPPEPPRHEQQLGWLAMLVGGPDVLAALHDDPLPVEALALHELPAHVCDRACAIDDTLAAITPVLLGHEALTATRRLLVRAVVNEPGLLMRSTRDDIAAGAVLWAVARGNDLLGPTRPLSASIIGEACGLRSSPAQRGAAFAYAAGGGSWWAYPRQAPDVAVLGDPALLLGRFRRRLMSMRDLALTLRAATPDP